MLVALRHERIVVGFTAVFRGLTCLLWQMLDLLKAVLRRAECRSNGVH
jgi:hypothetical protein